jgi:REP element-mobilizing transposase RayT
MARQLRIQFEGAVYHVASRGNAQQSIFLDDQDREGFLQVLASVVEKKRLICHVYCLMQNHYHLLIETPEGNLSAGMHQLNGMYTQYFNRRHGRVGHLFQGRYKAILVDKENYLLELCRYVLLNPVKAGAVKNPGQWTWSSYGATVGRTRVPAYLTVEWVLSQFGSEKGKAAVAFRKFVLEGLKRKSPFEDLKGQILLGTEEFIIKVRKYSEAKEPIREIPKAQMYATRPSLEELLPRNNIKGAPRDAACHQAHVIYGYTLREMGDYMGLHYTTISQAVRRHETRRRDDMGSGLEI